MTALSLLPTATAGKDDLFGSLLGGQSSATMQIVVFLTALTVLPAILVSLTPFLRLTVVLHFLRQALGTQSVPSNQILLGLSLFLTIVIMQPVTADAYRQGWIPYQEHRLNAELAWDEGTRPIRIYLLRFCREKDLALIIEITKTPPPRKPDELSIRILAPAYVLSELRASFQIGAVLFMPFLIIDLIVASLTLSIGMVQLPPAMISAPFKILLFVLVDGWNLVVGSLLRSVT